MLNSVIRNTIIEKYSSLNDFYLVASGTSMLPTIKPGDILQIKKKSEYKIGSIIVFVNPSFETENVFVVHRIIDLGKNKVFTKGDNLPFYDPVINIGNVLGEVVEIRNKGTKE